MKNMIASALALTIALSPAMDQSPVEYVLIDTPIYSFEVPKGWTVGKESPWGQRDIKPTASAGKLGAMTAGRTDRSWDDLYNTSLYFIQREKEGKPTPYSKGKTARGYESIRFAVANAKGFQDRHYVLMKNGQGDALALSVNIPSPADEKAYLKHFQHMVDTTKIK